MDSRRISSGSSNLFVSALRHSLMGVGYLCVCAFVFGSIGIVVSQHYDWSGDKATAHSLYLQRDSLQAELYDAREELKALQIQNFKDGK